MRHLLHFTEHLRKLNIGMCWEDMLSARYATGGHLPRMISGLLRAVAILCSTESTP